MAHHNTLGVPARTIRTPHQGMGTHHNTPGLHHHGLDTRHKSPGTITEAFLRPPLRLCHLLQVPDGNTMPLSCKYSSLLLRKSLAKEYL